MAIRTVGSGKTYSTVSSAISASSSGDIIELYEFFNETGLTLPGGVDLRGASGQDANGITSTASGTVLTLSGDNEVHGVRISSTHATSVGIAANTTGAILVQDAELSANTDTIDISQCSLATFRRVLFDDFEFDGALLANITAVFDDCVVSAAPSEDLAPLFNSWVVIKASCDVTVNNLRMSIIKPSTQHKMYAMRIQGAGSTLTVNGCIAYVDSTADSTDAAFLYIAAGGTTATVALNRVNATVLGNGNVYGCFSQASSGTTTLTVTASTGVNANPSGKWDTTNNANQIIPLGVGLPQKQLVGATESG